MEQFGTPFGIADALLLLLSCSSGKGSGDFLDDSNNIISRWAGDRIAIVGDYASGEALPMKFGADSIYALCHTFGTECQERNCIFDASAHYLDISDLVLPVLMLNAPDLFIDVHEGGWRRRRITRAGSGQARI